MLVRISRMLRLGWENEVKDETQRSRIKQKLFDTGSNRLENKLLKHEQKNPPRAPNSAELGLSANY